MAHRPHLSSSVVMISTPTKMALKISHHTRVSVLYQTHHLWLSFRFQNLEMEEPETQHLISNRPAFANYKFWKYEGCCDIDTSARRTENSEWIEINQKAPVHPLTCSSTLPLCRLITLPFEATAELAVLEITSIDCVSTSHPRRIGGPLPTWDGQNYPVLVEWHHIIEER